MCNIVIADDHPVVLFGTKTFLEQKGYNVVSACSNGLEAYNQIISRHPAITILDMSMPGLNGLEILEKLLNIRHPVKSILMTMHNDVSLFNKARELGVKGYLLKDFAMDEMEKCLVEVQKGNTYFSKHLSHLLTIQHSKDENPLLQQLTFAEKKILELVAQQKSTKDIAALLFISEKTVETHRSHIIKKLNIPPGKNALLIWAMKMKD
ncbi:MAG: response regulator transcription factor [Sphingobacteriales bacterium]|nr:MAG: response regulator transcription factor [Sphingobacteriales bacterium]